MTSDWQPIETAPKDGTEIDVWRQFFHGAVPASGERITDAVFESSVWCDSDGEVIEWGPDQHNQRCIVTHWMPRPTPPNEPTEADKERIRQGAG